MNYSSALETVEAFARDFFRQHTSELYVYHNQEHTEGVVKAAKQIAQYYKLSEEDSFVVTAAAWFHDLGYYIEPARHEDKGAELARSFMEKRGFPEDVMVKVVNCILSTKMPQNPSNLLEEIVCDADLFHLGSADFWERNKLMRKETAALCNEPVSKEKWNEKGIRLLEDHRYFTEYCRLLQQEGKKKNLEKLKRKALEEAAATAPGANLPLPAAAQATKNEPRKEKKERPERGIETMFRISSANHQRLSDMADNKANILITVNSIILSAIISLLLRRLEDHPYLIIPTFILLSVSMVTLVYAILATRPAASSGVFTNSDIEQQKTNLLFFGNFYKMSLKEYSDGMFKVMDDKSFLYGTLIRDLYSQGVVLGRKYHLLRIAYNIFMFGLIISVLAFIAASLIHSD